MRYKVEETKRKIAIPATKTARQDHVCPFMTDSLKMTSMYMPVLLDSVPLNVEPASLPLRITLASSALESDQSSSSCHGQLYLLQKRTLVLKLA